MGRSGPLVGKTARSKTKSSPGVSNPARHTDTSIPESPHKTFKGALTKGIDETSVPSQDGVPQDGPSNVRSDDSGISDCLSKPGTDPPTAAVTSPTDVEEVQLADEPGTNLDTLHKKQKEIEEENQKKKTLLHQAIAERYQKTAAEAKILTSVQVELDKIDLLLSNDVFILRDKIETANKTFEAARRRFESAEKEYVCAKIGLHKASEEKELLAEHLYTIIQQNELRKAARLNELMTKLHLGESSSLDSHDKSEIATPLSVVQRTPTPAISMSQMSKGLGSVQDRKSDIENTNVDPDGVAGTELVVSEHVTGMEVVVPDSNTGPQVLPEEISASVNNSENTESS
jgi:RAB6-interacting golgin